MRIRIVAAHGKTLYSSAGYKAAAQVFIDRQNSKPEALRHDVLLGHNEWLYRNKLLLVKSSEPLDPNTEAMLIKHFVLRHERQYEHIRREIEALENMEKLQTVSRKSIPDSVRLFVWQRDKGQCVNCGSREHLEFDHIIPVIAGGSSTERNVQLLCETCNRAKGSTI